ncbi:MAG TPA: hypothetical protein VH518_00615 [Tepidisphaeraceae bacterium]
MPPRHLRIYTALEIEARAVANALGVPFRPPVTVAPGVLAGTIPISLHLIGIRASCIPACQAQDHVSVIVLAGLAGALDPSLRCGDVVVDDPSRLLRLENPSTFHFGPIHTSDRIIATPSEKAELFRTTRALAVDMETEIVRRAADKASATCIVVRSISDSADQTLDPSILGLVDSQGRVKPIAVAATLVRRPHVLPQMLQTRARTRVALEALSRAVAAIVRSLSPG